MIVAVLDDVLSAMRYVLTTGYGAHSGARLATGKDDVSPEDVLAFAKKRSDVAVYSGPLTAPAEEIRRHGDKEAPPRGVHLFGFFELTEDMFRR